MDGGLQAAMSLVDDSRDDDGDDADDDIPHPRLRESFQRVTSASP
jgi:hypothetical protein